MAEVNGVHLIGSQAAPVVAAEILISADGRVMLNGGLGSPKQTAIALLSLAGEIMKRDMVDGTPIAVTPPLLVDNTPPKG